MANPLVPAIYDVIWTIAMVLLLAVIVMAIAMVVRRSRRRREEIAQLRHDVDALQATRNPDA